MNEYVSSKPRAALAVAAVAMTALTLGVLVVLPAQTESVRMDPDTLAAKKQIQIDVSKSPPARRASTSG
jgi:hypothetical protein